MSSIVSVSSKSKYQNLPGIAHDQPDTYETPDIPDLDQYIDLQQYEDINPNIETPAISVEAAYERFRSHKLNGEVNFDLYKGYRNDPEISPRPETVAEKLARLKLEIEELGEEMKTHPPTDSNQVNDLRELENSLGMLVKSGKSDSSVLKGKLEGYKDKVDSGNPLQYELHLEKKPVMTSSEQKANELESRIQRLEQVLGHSKDSLAPLGFQPKHSSVLGALTVLHSKLGLLEPSHIEIIDARLGSVLQKVNTILEKKLDVQELERNLKLSSLYELLETSASTIEALPELSERLRSLRELHGQASGVIREIGLIKAVQEGIAAGMGENDKLLRELKKTLETVVGEK